MLLRRHGPVRALGRRNRVRPQVGDRRELDFARRPRSLEKIRWRQLCNLAMLVGNWLESHQLRRRTATSRLRASVRSVLLLATRRRSVATGAAQSAVAGCIKTQRTATLRASG